MTDLKMDLPDVETLKNGEPWSWTWYDSVFRPVFRSRRCDRCGEVRETLGAFVGGTTKPANYLLFAYEREIVEKVLVALRLNVFCKPCFDRLRYNGSGQPPTASEIRDQWRKEKADGR